MKPMMVACPNCGRGYRPPEAEVKKATCTKCGCIMVLAKLEQQPAKGMLAAWPSEETAAAQPTKESASAAKAASAPVVMRRRGGDAPEATEKPKAPASRGGKPGAARKTYGKDGSEGGRRSRGGDGAKKSLSPLALAAIALGVVIVGVGIYFVVRNDKPTTPEQTTEMAKKNDAGAAPESDGMTDLGSLPGGHDTSSSKAPAPTNTGESPVANVDKKTPPPKKETPKSGKVELVPFEPTPGTAPELVESIKKNIDIHRDLSATRTLNIARDELIKTPRESMPLLINALMEIDRANYEDVQRGWNIIATLWDCSQRRAKFDNDFGFNVLSKWPEEGSADAKNGETTRKRAVEDWVRWWRDNKETWTPDTPGEEEPEDE